MRSIRNLLFLVICLSTITISYAGEGVETSPTETAPIEYQTYTVKPNDTLFIIAAYFNTTPRTIANLNNISNPNLIITGQELKIPQTEAPAPIPNTTRYTVRRGETLAQIAKKFETTVETLRQLNTIINQDLIFAGQIINVPLSEADALNTPEPTAQPTVELTQQPEVTSSAPSVEPTTEVDPTLEIEPTLAIEPTPAPTESILLTEEPLPTIEEPTAIPTLTVEAEPDPVFSAGIEVYYEGQDIANIVSHINELDLAWVRVRIDWRHIEPEQGVYNFNELDSLINMFYANNRQILATVTNAPDWARSSSDENGPPDDLSLFGGFLEALLIRYDTKISAYQIWDEPNLRRNWNCDRKICDREYIDLVQLASAIIWNNHPTIRVISAGLAPTRFNDSINAIDDRVFLENQLANGLGLFVDGIGVHPGGEANPPDATCCQAVNDITSHYENEVFYFLENLRGYHQIVTSYGLIDTPLWVTKFGWGTGEDVTVPSNPNQPHYSIRYTSLIEQAIYIPRALELGQELGYIEAMFINNLNGCHITLAGGLPELCFPSLIGADGLPRPVYSAVQGLNN